jgi:hypothetical protein
MEKGREGYDRKFGLAIVPILHDVFKSGGILVSKPRAQAITIARSQSHA